MTTKLDICDENEDSEQNDSSEGTCSESDSEHEETDSDEVNDEEENSKGNLAWVDSISKILKIKPKANKPIVLSKAKKLTEVKPKAKPAGFEVELGDGKVKKEEIIEETNEEVVTKPHSKKRKKSEIPDVRKKPNILEKDRERVLSKIATKGVVQLFNAVKNQQKELNDKLKEAGPLEVKKDKVLKNMDKNTFLDVLMSSKSQNVEKILENSNKTTNSSVNGKKNDNGKVWGVLRDNYMMDVKLKDWDKELETEEQNEMETE